MVIPHDHFLRCRIGDGGFCFCLGKTILALLGVSDPASGQMGQRGYPEAVPPSVLLMVIAALVGIILKKTKWSFVPVMSCAFLFSIAGIWLGLALKEWAYTKTIGCRFNNGSGFCWAMPSWHQYFRCGRCYNPGDFQRAPVVLGVVPDVPWVVCF